MRALEDAYPEIKKIGCDIIIQYPYEKLHNEENDHYKKLLKNLTVNLTHQHHKVRVQVLKAIGHYVYHNLSIIKINDIEEILLDPLMTTCCDRVYNVRCQTYETIAMIQGYNL